MNCKGTSVLSYAYVEFNVLPMLRNGTDLEGAFDTASHAALDKAMGAAGTSTNTPFALDMT
jgi:hypothetical protein